ITKVIKEYIKYYLTYIYNTIFKAKLLSKLNPVNLKLVFKYTICIDFIVTLLVIKLFKI
ncbi:hypothetical protein B0T21DRAFT_280534, partial [Apiosordaria backusii]